MAFATIDIAEGKTPDYPPLEGTPLTASDAAKIEEFLAAATVGS